MNATVSKKKIGKSVLSLVLVVLMLFSVIPFSANAATNGGVSEQYSRPDDYPNHNSVDYPPSGTDGYAQLKKSAKWSNEEKTLAEINLEAYGSSVSTQGADSVIILDLSGSMGSGATSKLGRAKTAAINFAKRSFEASATSRISVIVFDNKVGTPTKFYTAAEFTDLETYINTVTRPGTGGTAFMGPFEEAFKTLDAVKVQGRPQFAVFLTDGNPESETNPTYTEDEYAAAAKPIKDIGATFFTIAFDVSETSRAWKIMYAVASDAPAGQGYQGKYAFPAGATEIDKAYDSIFEALQLAGTAATVVDVLDDKFDFDISAARPVTDIDGNIVTEGTSTGEYSISADGRTITWYMGNLIDQPGKKINIPIKLKAAYHGVEGLYPTNQEAYMDYTNFNTKSCRQIVDSPILTLPYAALVKYYYKVDADGDALDYTGTKLTTESDFNLFKNLLDTITVQQDVTVNNRYTFVADDMITIDGVTYKFSTNAKFNSGGVGNNTYQVTIADNNAIIPAYFGYRELAKSKEVTLQKKYTPDLLDTVTERAAFKYQKLGTSNTESWTRSGDTYTMPGMDEEGIYKISETALYGYKAIADFYVKYDGTGIVLCDSTGKATVTPGVTVNGMTIEVTNEKDAGKTTPVSYQVEYYTTDGLISEVRDVDETVWVYDTVIPVSAGKIDLSNQFYGYKCDITAADLPTTVPVQGGLVRVPHSPDTSVTTPKSYYVEYHKDGDLTYRDTVTDYVWVGATHMDVDVSAINVTDYYGAGYAFDKTEPTSIPSSIEFGETISVYYVTDTGDTKPLTYHVEYYIDGDYVKTETYPISIWAGANTYEVTKADLEPFTGYRLQRTYPDLPYGVSDGETIEAYYVKDSGAVDQITYTFEYVDENGTELASPVPNTQTVWVGSPYVTVSTTDAKSIKGYILKEVQHTEAGGGTNVITLPNNKITDGDTVTFVYRTDPNATEEVTIKVAYYKAADHTTPAATENKKVTVKIGQKYNLAQSEVDTNKFAGEKIDSSKTSFPIAVGAGETAHIYFMIDASQLKTITYRIEHYLDDELQPNDTITVTDSSVPATSNTIAVTDTTQTYAGYRRTTEALNGQAADGDVFKVYYLRDLSITGPVTYTIRYHYALWNLPDTYTHDASMDEIITKEAWVGATEVDVLASELPDVTKPLEVGSETWILNTQKTIIPLKVEAGGYVDLFYIVKADVSIDIDGKTTYTSKMKAGDFDFEMVDKNGIQVAFGSNNAAGQIVLNLTVPLDSSVVIGSIDEYVVRYTGTGNANPLRPDTTEYIVQAQVVLNSSGIPTLKVTHYNKQIAFAMR